MAGWFRVSRLDPSTFMLHEQRYWQRNNSYLLVGSDAALLFDSGSGRRDITPVVRRLTDRPLFVICSHTHYDHIGNHHRLARDSTTRVLMPELAATRPMMRGTVLDPPWRARIAPRPRPFPVHRWWRPGDPLDLGDRGVELVALPGHTADSVGLLDRRHGFVLVGDFVYNAPVLAGLIPSAAVADYWHSARRLLALHDGERLYCGHYSPIVEPARLTELRAAAEDALTGHTAHPRRRPISIWRHGRTSLITSRTALRRPPSITDA